MEIRLSNCRNIKTSEIEIDDGCINVLYGVNGSGKSTIASVLEAGANSRDLGCFVPYGEQAQPAIIVDPPTNKVLVFNEQFVADNLYAGEQELISNGHRVFVETPKYVEARRDTEKVFEERTRAFHEDESLRKLCSDLDEFLRAYGSNPSGKSIQKNSPIMRSSFAHNNIVEHVPEQFGEFASYIHGEDSAKWYAWHRQGNKYIKGDTCPFCACTFAGRRRDIQELDNAFGNKLLDHTMEVASAFSAIREYFSEAAREQMDTIVRLSLSGVGDAEEALLGFQRDARYLRDKLDQLREFGFDYLNRDGYFKAHKLDIGKLNDYLNECRINLAHIPSFDSEYLRSVIDPLNRMLDEIDEAKKNLLIVLSRQRKELKKSLADGKEFIDDFLNCAGFPYEVEFDYRDALNCAIRLKPQSVEKLYVDKPSESLSYGERNSLAVALFAAKVMSENPDVIVLDDPISSFDESKRYAILHKLFGKEGPLRGKTCILLTHDYATVLIIGKVHGDKLGASSIHFIKNKQGDLSMQEIKIGDFKSFIDLCKDKMAIDKPLITRLVYARRLEELTNGQSVTWNYLSSLLHKEDSPQIKLEKGGYRKMAVEELEQVQRDLKEIGLGDINYHETLGKLRDNEYIIDTYNKTHNAYEKLGYIRVLCTGNTYSENKERLGINDVVWDFITSFYHAETESLYQLDPAKFSIVPLYVEQVCDKLVEAFSQNRNHGISAKQEDAAE